MAHATIIIPARYGSTRFPGKALAAETGKTLIQHVVEAARKARCADDVVIATDDERIESAAGAFECACVMTSTSHPNGTSRLAEAAHTLGLAPDAIVVNVQGDEPEIDPALIDLAAETLENSGAPMSTIASPFAPDEDPANTNIVKVVRAVNGDALYFSRSLIPHQRDSNEATSEAPLKHLGLYAYRASFLPAYVALAPTPLERAEQLEQLRALEHGHRIAVAVGDAAHHGVDTPEQYAAFVARWRAQVTS